MEKKFDVIELVDEIADRTNLTRDDICDGVVLLFQCYTRKRERSISSPVFLKETG